jgi:folate-binding protein YgfZ
MEGRKMGASKFESQFASGSGELCCLVNTLALHDFHAEAGARFTRLGEAETVGDYGDTLAEHHALRESVGVCDLSFRSRLCLTGADRVRFLHGQVTNDVKRLRVGEGCYAALVTAKGKLQSDLYIYCLAEELLLDFEPGLAKTVTERLEKYLVADDVQVVDVAALYGLLSLQGPAAEAAVRALGLFTELPAKPLSFTQFTEAALGELYLVHQPRLGSNGFDLFVPNTALATVAIKAVAAAKSVGGRLCGWQAFEMARLEAGIPRFGADMDETHLPPECGLEARAMSYTKGCYIGQEVLNRIHTMGHVNRELRGLRLAAELTQLPAKGTRLFHGGKEVGYVTSALASPALHANIALGYVRKEANPVGTELQLGEPEGSPVRVVELPFI